MRALDYSEFLKKPEVEQNFNHMFSRQKEYFSGKCSMAGFDKEHTELISIKMAIISTDLHFTELHSRSDNDNRK
ncbi:MAG: hypothetical protein UZ05_CHB002000315 [Chlorobi bacterium OLB5]|nr:MAG: hypothetical protein UZ05_CHB002000315 [Chlorobi bacterium OLB5]